MALGQATGASNRRRGWRTLIIDDTIEEKPYTDESELLLCWHYEHSKGRSVKGINLIKSALYHVEGGLTPNERTTSAYATAVSSIVACSYSDGLR